MSRDSEAGSEPSADTRWKEPLGDPLIVLGMHRSGTSALAGALSMLGVEYGEPLMAPRQGENIRGYFEHLEVYEFHQRLLEALGVSWDDLRSPRFVLGDPQFDDFRDELAGLLRRCFAGASLWAVKDPRACRFLPLWDAALAELGCKSHYLIILRHPDEVAASLKRRDRFSRDKSDLLWADHYLAAEAETRGAARAFISYADLLQSPAAELTRVAEELEIDWPAGAEVAASDELRRFLARGLRHHVATDTDLAPRGRLESIVPSLWQTLEAATTSTLDETACDSLRDELTDLRASFDPLLVEHFSQLVIRGEISRRVNELDLKLAELERFLRKGFQSTEEQLEEQGRWLKVQDDALGGQRDMLWALEEQIEERTRWLKIQDEILHRQLERIDQLENTPYLKALAAKKHYR